MARCGRCCLRKSLRAINLIMILSGIGMIAYSLWLQKKWDEGVAGLLPFVTYLPKPWFIYTCLGVGIAVCLSTLLGYATSNCINNSSLCIYIITISSLVLLEVAVIVSIFFKMDWDKEIEEYIDANHEKFKSFLIFHLKMCQLISLVILIPQINVIAIAAILWAIGTQPSTHRSVSAVPDFTQSFLVISNPPIPADSSTQICSECDNLRGGGTRGECFLSCVQGVFMKFRRSPDT
ncbi:Tetraspannin domain-containing protein [Cephalotus follicularis]|uniref:Tetraspannin domain-containing protein n=1 Tax=Cephalotus follicularis TaxID=3775 RepID=A0A1Q3DCP5_CEPFO|nr:Tetraspannin domain-containing protein [Cephalotus follicularis]